MAIWGLASLASKNRFLAPEPDGARDAVRMCQLWIWETDFGVLAAPFGRGIGQPDDTNAMRQPPLDCSLHQTWCQERERDRHVDLADAASFARGNVLDILDLAADQFLKPAPTLSDR